MSILNTLCLILDSFNRGVKCSLPAAHENLTQGLFLTGINFSPNTCLILLLSRED